MFVEALVEIFLFVGVDREVDATGGLCVFRYRV